VIALCGGENVFAHLPQIAPEVDAEAVLRAKPDIVVTSVPGAKPPVWLRDARFAVVTPDLIQRHTPRLLDGAEQVCGILDEVRAARS
jgi:iron complex transport system substrate-binding protein